MFSKPLPRFVIPKTLVSGATAFYFNVPTFTVDSAVRSRMSRSGPTIPLPATRTAKAVGPPR